MSMNHTVAELRNKLNQLKDENERLRKEYRSIVDNSLDAILLTSPDGRVHFANKAACSLFQMTEKEIIEGGRMAVVDEKDPRLAPALAQRQRVGSFRGEVNFKRKDGTIFPGDVSSVIFEDSEGQPFTSMIIRDLTQIRKKERNLKESELLLRSVFNALDEAVFVVTLDRKILSMNKSAELMFGYSYEKIAGRSTEILHVDFEHYKTFSNYVAATLINGQTANFEFEVKRKNGEIFPSDHTLSLLKDENEAKIGLISVVRDISKRKLSEIALEQSEKRYRNVVEYQTDIVFRFKPDGSITFMNETFRKLFQKNFKGERKKTWYSVLHKSDIRDIKHQLQEISLNKPTVILESRVWSADGALRWMQFVNRGFFEENGRLYEIQSVGRDITELKRMTQELEIKEKDLEAKHERLSELNAALKVLLDQREQEKNNFEEQLSKNINGLIIPYLIKIKKTGLNNLQTGYIENLESNLRLMTNPYIRGISFNLMQLSATETMVAELIKQGYRIKEIALRLNISPRTIEFHRTNIRKKLAIKGRKINLRTYLTNAS